MSTENSVKVSYLVSVEVDKGTPEEWELFLSSKKIPAVVANLFEKFLATEIKKAQEAKEAQAKLATEIAKLTESHNKALATLSAEIATAATSGDFAKVAELGQKISTVKTEYDKALKGLSKVGGAGHTGSGELEVKKLTVEELKARPFGYYTGKGCFVVAHSSLVKDDILGKLKDVTEETWVVFIAEQFFDRARNNDRQAYVKTLPKVNPASAFAITLSKEINRHSGIENGVFAALLNAKKISGSTGTAKQPFASSTLLPDDLTGYTWLK